MTPVSITVMLVVLGPAAFVPSYDVIVMDEYNGANYPHRLSNRTTGMPNTEITITATTLNGIDPDPGETVEFDCLDDSYLVPVTGSWPVTKTTDANGQAHIQVRGTGTGNDVDAVVVCKWDKGGTEWEDETTIRLFQETKNTSTTPQLTTTLSNPGSIKYSSSLTWMASALTQALSDWTSTNRVGFQTGTPAQIAFSEYEADDGALGITNISVSPRTVAFNKRELNGEPADTYWGYFPPLSQRHDPRIVANHEIGHALGLGHNQVSKYAVMHTYAGTARFVWNIQMIVSEESATFNLMYPEP